MKYVPSFTFQSRSWVHLHPACNFRTLSVWMLLSEAGNKTQLPVLRRKSHGVQIFLFLSIRHVYLFSSLSALANLEEYRSKLFVQLYLLLDPLLLVPRFGNLCIQLPPLYTTSHLLLAELMFHKNRSWISRTSWPRIGHLSSRPQWLILAESLELPNLLAISLQRCHADREFGCLFYSQLKHREFTPNLAKRAPLDCVFAQGIYLQHRENFKFL